MDLDAQLAFVIHRTDLLLTAHARTRLVDLGLTPEQNLLILLLADRGPMSQADVGTSLVKDKTTVARLLAALERKGLVSRTSDPADRRCLTVNLTEPGERLVAASGPVAERFQAEIVEGISAAEQATLHDLLARLRANLTSRSIP